MSRINKVVVVVCNGCEVLVRKCYLLALNQTSATASHFSEGAQLSAGALRKLLRRNMNLE